MTQVKHSAAWIYKQDYTDMFDRVSRSKEWLMLSCASLIIAYMISLYLLHSPPSKTPRTNKRKLEEDATEEQNRHIKRRLSIQAEKYRHASAFQTIQQQVGEDPRSWPVILLNEVILLREDLARVQKKSF